MNDWERLKLREAVLRDLTDFVPENHYGTLRSYEAESWKLDARLGQELKFSSSYPGMTARQRQASDLLMQLGLCGALAASLTMFEDKAVLDDAKEKLASMERDLPDLVRDYAACLSEDERKLLPTLAVNNTAQKDNLPDSARTSLLKMVLGMAMKRYKHDPRAKKNTAVAMIVRDLDMAGISISNDTVLAYLQEAAIKIPYNPHES